jgi:hypothetical protein
MQPLDFCNLAERLIRTEKNPEGFHPGVRRERRRAEHVAKALGW